MLPLSSPTFQLKAGFPELKAAARLLLGLSSQSVLLFFEAVYTFVSTVSCSNEFPKSLVGKSTSFCWPKICYPIAYANIYRRESKCVQGKRSSP